MNLLYMPAGDTYHENIGIVPMKYLEGHTRTYPTFPISVKDGSSERSGTDPIPAFLNTSSLHRFTLSCPEDIYMKLHMIFSFAMHLAEEGVGYSKVAASPCLRSAVVLSAEWRRLSL